MSPSDRRAGMEDNQCDHLLLGVAPGERTAPGQAANRNGPPNSLIP